MHWSIFQILLSVTVAFAVKPSDDHHVSKRQVVIYTANSAYNYAPQFAQSSYSFLLTDCSAGSLIAILTATNPVNTNLYSGNGYFYGSNGYNNVFGVSLGTNGIAYDADTNLPLTSTNVAVNYQTGQINLATQIYSTFTFNYRATNAYGATAVPVTVQCNSTLQSLNGINTVCFNNVCYSNSSGTITGSGTSISQLVCFDGNCYSQASSSSTTAQTGSFSSGYTCYTSTCTSGSSACAISNSGASSYGVSSGSGGFTISSTGALSLSTALSAGTYSLVIAAYNSSGSSTTTASTTVSIIVSCASSSSSSSSSSSGSFYINSTCLYGNCLFNYTAPSFSQSLYSFTQTNCSGGQTIGTVMASNAAGYYIETGAWSNYFVINSGVITSIAAVPTGTIATLTVSAYNANGVTTNIPVSINYSTCSSTASTTTTAASATSTATATTTASSFSFTPTFTQTSYNFSLATCTAATTIGQVFASGASYYSIAGPSNLFTISTGGVISTLAAPQAGTYYTSVTAINGTTGAATSVPVIITVACGTAGTGTTFTFTSTVPSTITTCTAGSVLGTVTATNAVAYGIDGGSTLFTINASTGQLSLATAITSGTYTIPVRAFGTTSSASQNVVVTFNC